MFVVNKFQKISTSDMQLLIKENSWIAKIAARKLQSDNVAIVIGRTIHLHHVSKEDFLKDEMGKT